MADEETKNPEEDKALVSVSAEVSDVFGYGKAAAKLFETVGARLGQIFSGVGEFMEVFVLDKKRTENDAFRIRQIGKATAEATELQWQAIAPIINSGQRSQVLNIVEGKVSAQLSAASLESLALQQRSAERVGLENAMSQLHLESSVAYAAEEVEAEHEISPEPVEPSWVTQWTRFAQDASSEEMQRLWGRILAGEVKNPGSFSPRTLQLMSLLTQKEAQLFQRACAFNWRKSNGEVFITIIPKGDNTTEFLGFTPLEIQILDNIGLIEFSYLTGFGFDEPQIELSYNGSLIEVGLINEGEHNTINVGQGNLTPMGTELASICIPKYEQYIMEETIKYWIKKGYRVSSPYISPSVVE